MKRILITGATGFVGLNLLDQLQGNDVSITVVGRGDGKCLRKKYQNIEKYYQVKNVFEKNISWWKLVCSNIDVVVHAAWYVEPGKYFNSLKNLECLEGSLKIGLGSMEAHVKKFVGIGTCFEYQSSLEILLTNSPILPNNLYASSKASLYFLLKEIFKENNIPFAWCRLFYLYGKYENKNRLFASLNEHLKNNMPIQLSHGNQVKDFIDIEIAIRNLIRIILGDEVGAFNICSGTPTTIRDFANKIADQYGKRDLLKFGEKPENIYDPIYLVGKSSF